MASFFSVRKDAEGRDFAELEENAKPSCHASWGQIFSFTHPFSNPEILGTVLEPSLGPDMGPQAGGLPRPWILRSLLADLPGPL